MPNLPPKTHVADGECHCCGKPVKILLNKNSHAYYFCGWINETGNQCNGHARWGHDASQKMQIEYLAARKAAKPKDTPPDAEENNPPAAVRKQSSAGGDRDDIEPGAIEHATSDTGTGGWGLGDY